MQNQNLDYLLRREVTRAEFLKYSAMAMAGALGFLGISRTLTQLLGHKQPDLFTMLKNNRAYGARYYGK